MSNFGELRDIKYNALNLVNRLNNLTSHNDDVGDIELTNLRTDLMDSTAKICDIMLTLAEDISSRESLINPVFGKNRDGHLLDCLVSINGFSEDVIASDKCPNEYKIINSFSCHKPIKYSKSARTASVKAQKKDIR